MQSIEPAQPSSSPTLPSPPSAPTVPPVPSVPSVPPAPPDPSVSSAPSAPRCIDAVPIAPAPGAPSPPQFNPSTPNSAPRLPASSGTRLRAVQFVTTVADRRNLAEWMSAEVARSGTERHIASKVVREFPSLFPGNPKANLMRATRIWRQRGQLLKWEKDQPSATDVLKVRARVQKHSLPGRGRKRAAWSEKLQINLIDKYYRLKSAGFNFTPSNVREAAVALLQAGRGDAYLRSMKDPRSDKLLLDCLTPRWVRTFADRWRVNLDDKPARNTVPMYKQRQVDQDEKLIAYHLGVLARQFATGTLNENNIEVVAPIQFTFNATNGKTLGFGEDEQPDFAELVSGAGAMTMLVRISGGKDAKLLPPLMIFQNAERMYPMPIVPDDSPDVHYRTSPTGWIDTEVLASFYGDKKGHTSLETGKRVMFVEASPWLPFETELEKLMSMASVEVRFLPRNGCCFTHPMEFGVRDRIMELWKEGWQQAKKRMIDIGVWNDEGRDASGKLFNAGPRFFMKLAAAAMETVNGTSDSGEMKVARNAMIQAGISTNVGGKWELEQLHPELRAIATKHKRYFAGEIVTEEKTTSSAKSKAEPSNILPVTAAGHQSPQEVPLDQSAGPSATREKELEIGAQQLQQTSVQEAPLQGESQRTLEGNSLPNENIAVTVEQSALCIRQDIYSD